MRNSLKSYGQASIEYTLLVAVLAVMIVSIMGKVEEYMVGTGPCPNDSLLCAFIQSYSSDDQLSGNFRKFRLRR